MHLKKDLYQSNLIVSQSYTRLFHSSSYLFSEKKPPSDDTDSPPKSSSPETDQDKQSSGQDASKPIPEPSKRIKMYDNTQDYPQTGEKSPFLDSLPPTEIKPKRTRKTRATKPKTTSESSKTSSSLENSKQTDKTAVNKTSSSQIPTGKLNKKQTEEADAAQLAAEKAAMKTEHIEEVVIPPPKKLKQYLDMYVIGQERAKKHFSVAIYNHYIRMQDRIRRDEASQPYKEELKEDVIRSANFFSKYRQEIKQTPRQVLQQTVQNVANRMENVLNDSKNKQFDSGENSVPKILKQVDLEKSNVLLFGTSGSGKTLLARVMSDLLDVPFVISDCTSMTQAGYVGEDAESCVVQLANVANWNIHRAETGIIVLDEFDKLAFRHNSGGTSGGFKQRDVGGEGVQQALLKLVEGKIVKLDPTKSGPDFQVDTSNILFIFMGAFNGLEKIVMNRLKKEGSYVEEETDTDTTVYTIDDLTLQNIEDLRNYQGTLKKIQPDKTGAMSINELSQLEKSQLGRPKTTISDIFFTKEELQRLSQSRPVGGKQNSIESQLTLINDKLNQTNSSNTKKASYGDIAEYEKVKAELDQAYEDFLDVHEQFEMINERDSEGTQNLTSPQKQRILGRFKNVQDLRRYGRILEMRGYDVSSYEEQGKQLLKEEGIKDDDPQEFYEHCRYLLNNNPNGILKPSKKEKSNMSILNHATHEDLINYGIIPELAGRISVIVNTNDLTVDDLERILTEPKNALLKQYQYLFKQWNVELIFTQPAIRAIAEICYYNNVTGNEAKKQKENTLSNNPYSFPAQFPEEQPTSGGSIGARGLSTLLSQLLLDANFETPHSGAKFILVTSDVIKNKFKSMLPPELKETDDDYRTQKQGRPVLLKANKRRSRIQQTTSTNDQGKLLYYSSIQVSEMLDTLEQEDAELASEWVSKLYPEMRKTDSPKPPSDLSSNNNNNNPNDDDNNNNNNNNNNTPGGSQDQQTSNNDNSTDVSSGKNKRGIDENNNTDDQNPNIHQTAKI